MVKKTATDVSALGKLARKEMVRQVLRYRNGVGVNAKLQSKVALSTWQSTAPHKTGKTGVRNAVEITEKYKYSSGLSYKTGELAIISNSNNKYGKYKDFITKLTRLNGNEFLNKKITPQNSK